MDASTAVPRPGVERIDERAAGQLDPFAHRCQSHPPRAQVIAHVGGLEAPIRRPRSRCAAVTDRSRRARVRGRRRACLPTFESASWTTRYASVSRSSGTSRAILPVKSTSMPASLPKRINVSRRAGMSPRSSNTGGRSPDIKRRSDVGLLGELLRGSSRARRGRGRRRPALIISSAASSDSDAAETPWTGPSCRSRAIRFRSCSIAAFVRRRSRVRSSSRSCRNLKSERIVSSATFAAVTSRTSRRRARRIGRHARDRATPGRAAAPRAA